jgi:serine/threonine-protein kinase
MAEDQDAMGMLMNEARLAARLHHPNVVAALDVVVERGDAYVIMEYVHGESLGKLLRAAKPSTRPSAGVISSVLSDTLRGLHAAHEARNEQGEPLEIIHRDVSPQNVLVGTDGIARLIDFGIAKARSHARATTEGRLKGKLAYLAPEQIRGQRATRRTDVYAAGVVLWEALTSRRLFHGDSAGAIMEQILVGWVEPPGKYVPEIPEELDDVVLRALETDPSRRFATAHEMAEALEAGSPPASATKVGAWVRATAGDILREREDRLRSIEGAEVTPQRLRSWVSRRAVLDGIALAVPVMVALQIHTQVHDPLPVAEAPETAKRAPPLPSTVPEPLPATTIVAVRGLEPADDDAKAPVKIAAHSAVSHAPAARPTPRTVAADCDPPYTVNDEGIRIYKRRCLKP